ncbi:YbgC/FadM family acyl-CoA thioesterase [Novosphingobium sp. 9]|uniref:YbgC/FadM family acyl-CoA thioesterase n=1 Tax=Novosphingobium sp. 9 TaxID=2025349 RepID=UPI0021B55D09|nr:YbgC/FadM family acyl-CoA thioesterase [Novosphingobium sp. 9]
MTDQPLPPGGRIDGGLHRFALRVYYEDTDAGGVVYHANYIRWFERARSDLVELLGIDQRAAIEGGVGMYTVAEIAIRYRAPGKLGDAVVIETRPLSVGRVACTLHQIARRGETVLAEATVKVGFISLEGKPARQPEAWLRAFVQLAEAPSIADAQDARGREGQE